MVEKILLTLLSLSSLASLSLSSSPPTDGFVFGGCTEQKYSPESGYESNVDSLLSSLVNSATYSSYNNFTVTGSGPGRAESVTGLFQCRGDLAMPDCAACVTRAVTALGGLCGARTCGGAIQLQGCYVKYDNATFLGVEDKTVVLKKCGPSEGSYDSDGLARRDAVLGSLGASGGPYRVGGAGDVQGVAQCVGDLSFLECQDCLGEAIGELKSNCGEAVYGDMFLAKCYARYSTAGAHSYANGHHDDDDKSSGDGEKTFAVIIGLLAGVALLIIFLAFLRKMCEGSGK